MWKDDEARLQIAPNFCGIIFVNFMINPSFMIFFNENLIFGGVPFSQEERVMHWTGFDKDMALLGSAGLLQEIQPFKGSVV